MSDIPSLEILSNVNAKYNSATFKTIVLKGDSSDATINKATWDAISTKFKEIDGAIATTVSTTTTNQQTIQSDLKLNGKSVLADSYKSASGNSITAFTYVSNKGFDYSNIYQMKAYGKTDPFFKIDNGNITFEATNVKGTTIFEGGKALSEVYLKKGAVPADVYSKTDVDGLLSKKADKATTLSGYGITDAYTKSATDTALAKKADTTTLTTELAKKQDTLKVNSNIFAGDNVNITQSASGAITISSTGGGGTVDAYTKAETDKFLNKKQNTLTEGSNISITQTADALVINTKEVYSKAEINSKVTTLQDSKQDTLVPGTNLMEGDNVTITKDTTSGKITISALADLTDILNRISALEKQLGGYTLKSVTQSEYDSLTTKDANTLYLIKAS